MPLIVECVGIVGKAKIYSLAHCGELIGDLMADPDMTFLAGDRGDVFPLTYENHYVPNRATGGHVYQVAAECVADNGSSWRINERLQHQLVDFANQWMKNVKDQHEL